jgi:Asp-tRNA(Asn)/Glu-tRNA(Gln) amidotransferase A subunit family amidase
MEFTMMPDDCSNDCSSSASVLNRRHVLAVLASLGIGTPVFQRALAADADKPSGVTLDMVRQAEWIAGLTLSDTDRQAILNGLTQAQRDYTALRALSLPNDVPLALSFVPGPWLPPAAPGRGRVEPARAQRPKKPEAADDLAFLPVTALAGLLRTRQVSSTELTKLYLERLKKYDPALRCVVTLTEELALKQAEQADKEIAAGRYRGPLHGVPWGAKDLIACPGYKTTWGAAPYKEQRLEQKATVVKRLEEAGAVLVAKLSLGALAQGDRWFGGMTRNPWNPRAGSSGSSAGSASATTAGLVGFALGSETLGSIISPCSVCGTTGLRPTFGRVSRHGCMTLAWSMDKIGPLARSVEDCALVLGAIHGHDGLDASAVERPFAWPAERELKTLRVGYFEGNTPEKDREELRVLRDLGVSLVPLKPPSKYPPSALRFILNAEAATAFDEVTRKGITEGLNTWPATFRQGQFVPAVEYLRANRIRTLLMREMAELMNQVDLYVGGWMQELMVTNLTGHPTVVLPNGMRKIREVDVPRPLTFTGRLYGESELLAVAHAYQEATGHHRKRPPMEKVTAENADPK